MSSSELSVDAELVRQLALLLNETGLTEIEYAVGERRIRVARGAAPAPVSVTVPAAPAALAPAAPAAAAEHPGAVKSPMVGTAYLAPQPGAAAFVKEGDGMPTEGTLTLYLDDDPVGEAKIKTQPGKFSLAGEGLNVGKDGGEPVTDDYPGSAPWAGLVSQPLSSMLAMT